MKKPKIEKLNGFKKVYSLRDRYGIERVCSFNNPAFIYHMQEREWEILKLFRSQQVVLEGVHVFEVGCGTGHILQRFLEFGATEAAGIDLLKNRIEMERIKYPNVRLIHGNAAEIPCEDNSFDIVMQFMCFSSILDSGLREKIASEMWRITKPGGVILFYDMRPVPGVIKIMSRIQKNLFRRAHRDTLPKTPIAPLTIKDIKGLFPDGIFSYRSVSLLFKLAQISDKSHLTAEFLSSFPALRTHNLVLIRKISK